MRTKSMNQQLQRKLRNEVIQWQKQLSGEPSFVLFKQARRFLFYESVLKYLEDNVPTEAQCRYLLSQRHPLEDMYGLYKLDTSEGGAIDVKAYMKQVVTDTLVS